MVADWLWRGDEIVEAEFGDLVNLVEGFGNLGVA